MWSSPGRCSSNGAVLSSFGNWWMPTIVPLPSIQTTWWKVPVSSSITGSEPKSCWYQGRLTLRSFTVTATWPSGGKSGISIPLCSSVWGSVSTQGPRRSPPTPLRTREFAPFRRVRAVENQIWRGSRWLTPARLLRSEKDGENGAHDRPDEAHGAPEPPRSGREARAEAATESGRVGRVGEGPPAIEGDEHERHHEDEPIGGVHTAPTIWLPGRPQQTPIISSARKLSIWSAIWWAARWPPAPSR